MPADSKAREKEYLRRSGSLAWERIKPFSPPATDTLAESTRLVHDFAVALNALDAALNHRVLDLGAGACWTSEWLHRLNLRVVSLDIAHDMLAVARDRADGHAGPGYAGADSPGLHWPLVTGDLESLPFDAGAFDRALCMNALHHLPHPERALAEIARVLTPGGRLVLIEPGLGHADNPTSLKAVEDFGVLERELEATALMRMCTAAGFTSVRLLPLSYATEEIALTTEQVEGWRAWTRTKRPLRALKKLRLALLEFFGRGKDAELFEDSLSIWFSRVLARHAAEQGFVVASKPAYAPAAGEWRAHLALGEQDTGEREQRFRIVATNTGSRTWRRDGKLGSVRLGAQLLDEHRARLGELPRVALPSDVTPGDHCVVDVVAPDAATAEAVFLKVDLVCEQVAWFEDRGSPPLLLSLKPRGSDAPVARRDG